MRRRLYYLLPDQTSARKVVNDLLLAHIEFNHIHMVGNDKTDMSDLPAANMLQTSDLIRAMELGLITGGATGACAGIAFTMMPSLAAFSTGGLILLSALAGAIIGSWAAGMIGINVRNTRLRPFENKIENGEMLMMVDVPKHLINDVNRMVTSHLNVSSEGMDHAIPAFP